MNEMKAAAAQSTADTLARAYIDSCVRRHKLTIYPVSRQRSLPVALIV